ncbi:hypothetical protein PCASD_18990 [Puccinia coronata f. sp. avenae]|uniref:Uncharacterized protein n=1 Tax=Puccinia coronata f. sp. avenae TaxID=200324 RepID=A0A2N5SRS5_9BASI|nr:hypothetical protein PCASD_18990 [Puccinia coronata f. sp. avenae]
MEMNSRPIASQDTVSDRVAPPYSGHLAPNMSTPVDRPGSLQRPKPLGKIPPTGGASNATFRAPIVTLCTWDRYSEGCL